MKGKFKNSMVTGLLPSCHVSPIVTFHDFQGKCVPVKLLREACGQQKAASGLRVSPDSFLWPVKLGCSYHISQIGLYWVDVEI